MPAQNNARLVSVYGPQTASTSGGGGATDAWDYGNTTTPVPAPASSSPDDDGPPRGELRASPNAPGYYREVIDRSTGPAGLEVTERRTLIIDTAVAIEHDIATDDVLAIDTFAGQTIHARAASIARTALPLIPGLALAGVETTRIELESS